MNFIDKDTEEVLDTASYKDFISNAADVDGESEEDENAPGLSSAAEIAQQETVTVADTSEFYVDYAAITDDVLPPQPGDWYTHYEADDGKVYVDLCIGYKNWKEKNVGADEVLSATLTYDGKYEYTGFSMIEQSSRSDFTYSNITSIAPLTTEYLHYLFEVPAEVESGSGSIEISFVIGGNSYTCTVR